MHYIYPNLKIKMMKKLILTLSLATALLSCNDDAEINDVIALDRKGAIQKEWTLKSITSSVPLDYDQNKNYHIDILRQLKDCKKDDTYTFTADSFSVNDNNESCSDTDISLISNDSYTFKNNYNTISFPNRRDWYIEEFTTEKLVVEEFINSDPDNIVKLTYVFN